MKINSDSKYCSKSKSLIRTKWFCFWQESKQWRKPNSSRKYKWVT